MANYTTRLQDRDPGKRQRTGIEAAAMLQAGCRFAEFSTGRDVCRLSIPWQFVTNPNLDYITREQA